MNKKLVINYVMAISLFLVMGSGMLLRSMPGMWLGITHSVSGMILTISILVHCFQHRRKRR